MPQKRTPRGKAAPLQLNHEEAQACLLAYSYGRLTPAEDAAVEAHIAGCKWCRADGLRHLAAERIRAMQQRAKTQRQPAGRAIAVVLSVLLAALLGFSGFLVVAAAHAGAFRSLGHQSISPTAVPPTSTPTLATTSTPTALKAQTSIPASNVDTLAWSPDGTILATAALPNPSKGTTGGVVLYQNISSTLAGGPLLQKRLFGFENVPSPGTLAWSPDGSMLAASGHAHLIIWNVNTGQAAVTVGLPTNPGTNLYVFDTLNATLVMSAPSSIFLASGFVQWGQNGIIRQAPAGAAGPTGIPGPLSPIMALWGGQQGTHIFRDTSNVTMLGTSYYDVQDLAAFMRWSPDHRYLVWGYPRVPVSTTLLARQPTHATTMGVPDAVFATSVQTVEQNADPSAEVEIWPATDGTRLIVFDSTAQPVTFTLMNASTGTVISTLNTGGKMGMLLNQVSFQRMQPFTLATATLFDSVTIYGAGS